MAPQGAQINKAFGNRGEHIAAVFFTSRGFRVIARNWSTRVGEIDLICEKDGVTHFVEVKTRRSSMYGNPEEAVTPTKLRHFRRAVESYLLSKPLSRYQMDVLAILAEPGKPSEFHYIENV